MELENQVVSLELAKRLKELGVKQESVFKWVWHDWNLETVVYQPADNLGLQQYSAFTVAELGSIIRTYTKHLNVLPAPYDDFFNEYEHSVWAEHEADTRAKMLCYLLENKFLKL